MTEYETFIEKKSQLANGGGFKPVFMPDAVFDFQKYLIEWCLWNARSACFADCGMGKALIGLTWAENIVRHINRRVLIVTPLAVSYQMKIEAEKFGISVSRSHTGELNGEKIIITNYERLEHFNPNDFSGVLLDESSRVKNAGSKTRKLVTEFMKKIPYRLLATATAAPNDYIELGTSSEALGYLGHVDMLNRFFKNDKNNSSQRMYFGKKMEWRFKGHAEIPFWKWVASWARAMRKPSDFGFSDEGFILPPLIENEHLVEAKTLASGMLFDLPAIGLDEQREEQKRTIKERCEKVAEIVNAKNESSLIWCNLIDEGNLLEKIINDSVQVSGKDSDEEKEEKIVAFINGGIKRLITKLKIAGFGLNFQHCAHTTYFPDHSYEKWYQGIRRLWRFGQKRPVVVDIITTEGQKMIMANIKRKAEQAEKMFINLIAQMNDAMKIERKNEYTKKASVPKWL